jgi:hypothetical protein
VDGVGEEPLDKLGMVLVLAIAVDIVGVGLRCPCNRLLFEFGRVGGPVSIIEAGLKLAVRFHGFCGFMKPLLYIL